MISPLIDHLTCHLCFYWFSFLMHLQEESSCAPPPLECKDQAFVPERSTRDEVSLLVILSKAAVIQISWFLLVVLCGFSPFWNISFCYSWICCMRRRSTPWSIVLGYRRQNMLPTKGTFSTTCRRLFVVFSINCIVHDSNSPASLHNNTMCFVPLVLQIHQDLNKYHALIDF